MKRSVGETIALSFVGAVGGAVLGAWLAGGQAFAQVGPVRARPEMAQPAEKPAGGPTVTTAAPSRAVLTPGGAPVIVTLRGTQLEGLSGAEVLAAGQPRREIAASLKYVPGTALVKRSLTLSAWPGAEPGEYQVRLLGDGFTLTLPPEIVQVVVAGDAPKASAPAASAPPASPKPAPQPVVETPAAPVAPPKAAPKPAVEPQTAPAPKPVAEPQTALSPKPAAEPPPAPKAPAAAPAVAAPAEPPAGSAPATAAPAEEAPAAAPSPAK